MHEKRGASYAVDKSSVVSTQKPAKHEEYTMKSVLFIEKVVRTAFIYTRNRLAKYLQIEALVNPLLSSSFIPESFFPYPEIIVM